MSKTTYNVFLRWHRSVTPRQYLEYVVAHNELEAEAAAECSLSSHDPDECYLEVVPLFNIDMENENDPT